jgi:hypothetical protein
LRLIGQNDHFLVPRACSHTDFAIADRFERYRRRSVGRLRQGERIYHMPGGLSYAKVNMNAPGKRWFCTEDEAKAAGWRPAYR